MLEKRVPPQNIEAEQAVLGAMLIDKEAIIQVSEILTNIDFYQQYHRGDAAASPFFCKLSG